MYDDVVVIHDADRGREERPRRGRLDAVLHHRPLQAGYSAVLVQQSRLGEISRQELVEVITEAWAAKAPKKLVREHLGE